MYKRQDFVGSRVYACFRCNLPPALLAEWLGSFTFHCGNTGVEWIPNKSQHGKLTLEKKNSAAPPARIRNLEPVDHGSGAVPTSCPGSLWWSDQKLLRLQTGPRVLCVCKIFVHSVWADIHACTWLCEMFSPQIVGRYCDYSWDYLNAFSAFVIYLCSFFVCVSVWLDFIVRIGKYGKEPSFNLLLN